MQSDIRLRTVLVVHRDNQYLVGRDIFGNLRWSNSVYDAKRKRNPNKALLWAIKTGGGLMLFNPVVGQTKMI